MNSARYGEPIAVTGLGAITAQGCNVEHTWRGISSATDVLRSWNHPLPEALRHIHVAPCPDYARPSDLPAGLWNKLARTQQLACISTDEALQSAGLPRRQRVEDAMGCFIATTVCGMDLSERFYQQYRMDADSAELDLMRRMQPYEVLELLSRRHRLSGPGYMNLTTCVGSAMAIGAACDAIQAGRCERAIAGGTEALCQLLISGFNSLRLVAANGCRPFDRDRPGITVGEGSAMLVLESIASAQRRGVTPIGYVRGYAATCDAYHITKPESTGFYAAQAIKQALADAGVSPRQVDYINAHGTGTRDNDTTESAAIHSVFDSCRNIPPVSSTKRLTGHTFGAAGAIEAAICLLALQHGVLPPNAGSNDPDPSCNLPLVQTAMATPVNVAVSCNLAFGGNNTALVFTRTGDVTNPAEKLP
jgi:3-oxoacyl-(acyl-carrier-protein) synthase